MAIRRSGLIKRPNLKARRPTEQLNDFNEVVGVTFKEFTAFTCTVQPYEGSSMTPDPIGFSERDVYTVFTNTLLQGGAEGSTTKADELFIYGKWCRVIKVKPWLNGVNSHYEVICIAKDEGLI